MVAASLPAMPALAQDNPAIEAAENCIASGGEWTGTCVYPRPEERDAPERRRESSGPSLLAALFWIAAGTVVCAAAGCFETDEQRRLTEMHANKGV